MPERDFAHGQHEFELVHFERIRSPLLLGAVRLLNRGIPGFSIMWKVTR